MEIIKQNNQNNQNNENNEDGFEDANAQGGKVAGEEKLPDDVDPPLS